MISSNLVYIAACAAAGVFLVSPITSAFSPSNPLALPSSCASTKLQMANDDDLIRWARSNRAAQVGDRVVELRRPLGIVLDSDDSGNVYVDAVAPMGNAARSGLVSHHHWRHSLLPHILFPVYYGWFLYSGYT